MGTKKVLPRKLDILIRSMWSVVLLCVYTNKKPPAKVTTIAVMQMAQLGDMVCTTPVFRAIKKKFPHVRVIVVGTKGGRGILEGNTDVDHYVVVNETSPSLTTQELHELQIDAGVLMVPSLDSLVLLAHAKLPFIVAPKLVGGYSPANTKLYKLLSGFVVTKPHYYGNYAAREYLRLLEPLGIFEEDTTKHLVYSSEAKENVDTFLSTVNLTTEDRFACIVPGAGNKVKQWPAERFAAIADYLWMKYSIPIVIIGSTADREEVEIMKARVHVETNYIDTCGTFSLDETKAIIAHTRLLIAADTMAIYIAEAFNTPLIDIVGPVDEKEQPPAGKNRVIVVPPGERTPQMHVMNARVYDKEEVLRQAAATTVSMVQAAVDSLKECLI